MWNSRDMNKIRAKYDVLTFHVAVFLIYALIPHAQALYEDCMSMR